MSVAAAHRGKRRRASALAAVHGGVLPVRQVLRDVPTGLGTCPVYRVLLAAPGLGPQGVRQCLERAGVWPLLTMSELSRLQRQAILNELPRRVL